MRITQKNNKQKRKNTRSITVKAINTTITKEGGTRILIQFFVKLH
jgi:hypothetical protein